MNNLTIKSLAHLKRLMVVGSEWESVRLLSSDQKAKLRKVVKVQTNGVYMSLPNKEESSFFEFTKAKDYAFVGNKVIAHFPNGTPYAVYKYLGK